MQHREHGKLIRELKSLKGEIGSKQAKRLNLKLLQSAANKMRSFAIDCNECEKHLEDLTGHVELIRSRHGKLERRELRQHQRLLNGIVLHMRKKHKLVAEGYYSGVGMSFGMSLGLGIGLGMFGNPAVGIAVGLAAGIGVGAALDNNAKKKGRVI